MCASRLQDLLLAFEDACCTHACTDAHRHHAKLFVRPLQLGQQCRDLPGASATEGVPQGDGSALRVDLLHRDLQVLHAHGCLGSEGLVDLEDVHVVDRNVGLLQSLRDCERRADAHHLRIHAHDSEAPHAREDGEPQLLGRGAACQEHHGCTVGDLARVPGRGAASCSEGRLQGSQALNGGASAWALVLLDDNLGEVTLRVLHPRLHGNDLGVEPA
mmetsp:Transcript_31281/g.79122  ORF Transcript_31281/g.79122 Transcript_31281/m.79122 type:complete len:216 (-) Transcript_31281:754-1401(-)